MKIELDPRPEVLSFDCYGTLVDWEAGILSGLRPVLAGHSVAISDGELLQHYAELEAEAESEPYRPYKEVLRAVVRALGSRLGFMPSPSEEGCLVGSFPDWRPFPDTVPALQRLRGQFRLMILSNTDDDLFAETYRHLEVDFVEVITAEQLRSYKPSSVNFAALIERSGGRTSTLLHVAESLFHDIGPAKQAGLRTVWVNRPKRFGAGATPTTGVEPHHIVPDLAALADALTP